MVERSGGVCKGKLKDKKEEVLNKKNGGNDKANNEL